MRNGNAAREEVGEPLHACRDRRGCLALRGGREACIRAAGKLMARSRVLQSRRNVLRRR